MKENKTFDSELFSEQRMNEIQKEKIELRKRILFNVLNIILLISFIYGAYFLFWGLIIEPNLPRHIYGPGDLLELYYTISAFVIFIITYIATRFIDYEAVKWEDINLSGAIDFLLKGSKEDLE